MAERFVNYTTRHVLLTGGGGTGKSTFLKKLRMQSTKKLVVVAPTSIAALNVGGSTIHSFFQLPPDLLQKKMAGAFAPKLAAFSKEKRAILQALELMVIDEISMVRADVLEAIDETLRNIRGIADSPFGGVQLLMVGDLYQLPPVLAQQEQDGFYKRYESPYFFGAAVVKELDIISLELIQNYRQASDPSFQHILNCVRIGNMTASEITLLNQRSDLSAAVPDDAIVLTTHNAKATAINQQRLAALSNTAIRIEAIVTGEFQEALYPADKILTLKLGAPIIFLKNDSSGKKRYFNGQRGKFLDIRDNFLLIQTQTGDTLSITKETWLNTSFAFDESTRSIQELILGEFEQYPVQLAWAITIHKSQGLTFDKAVIDSKDSFSPGQLYVALSRLRSLEGLYLLHPLQTQVLAADPQIKDFLSLTLSVEEATILLAAEIDRTLHKMVLSVFDFSAIYQHALFTSVRSLPAEDNVKRKISDLQTHSERFLRQLQAILDNDSADRYANAQSRTASAAAYFTSALCDLLSAVSQLRFTLAKDKTPQTDLVALIERKVYALSLLKNVWEGIENRQATSQILDEWHRSLTAYAAKVSPPKVTTKLAKADPLALVVELIRSKHPWERITATLSITTGQMDQQVVKAIQGGQLACSEFIPTSEIIAVRQILQQFPDSPFTGIQAKISSDIPARHVKFIMAEWHSQS